MAHTHGIYTNSDFLNSPSVQDYAITACHKKVCQYIKSYGLDAYVGKNYCGVPITQSGLLAACHLVGVGSMKDALPSGVVVWDGNGVEASEYLQMFNGYDIGEVWGS